MTAVSRTFCFNDSECSQRLRHSGTCFPWKRVCRQAGCLATGRWNRRRFGEVGGLGGRGAVGLAGETVFQSEEGLLDEAEADLSDEERA